MFFTVKTKQFKIRSFEADVLQIFFELSQQGAQTINHLLGFWTEDWIIHECETWRGPVGFL